MGTLTTLDAIIFFGSLLIIMGVGIWVGRKEEDSTDYYLAGRSTRWWGVAGSIFGTNVSANHLVGMMGVGFAAGFAQSHFEITAIAGLLMLCYAFLPMYRRLNVFTLSEYLARRYNEPTRLIYALIMMLVMVVVQMVPGFYIGSRSINLLLDNTGERATAQVKISESGGVERVVLRRAGGMYTSAPAVELSVPEEMRSKITAAKLVAELAEHPVVGYVVTDPGLGYDTNNPPAVVVDGPAKAVAKVGKGGRVTDVLILDGGQDYDVANPPKVTIAPPPVSASADGSAPQQATAAATVAETPAVARVRIDSPGAGYSHKKPPELDFVGGAAFDQALSPGDVRPSRYVIGIVLMALITGAYVVFGGLKAVIITDVIQSILLLVAGLLVAYFLFSDPSVGGWGHMVATDAAEGAARKLTLYKPIDDPKLPWTGVLSGLMVLHFYYWGNNQFIVQRALSARTDREARLGIIMAGFFKLLIPFFSIGTGIAAFYMFRKRGVAVDQDAVFIRLLTDFVAPVDYGLVGVIAAGVIGAILSSLDSMMNSAATIFTFDIYKRFVNPAASEQKLILVGRVCIVLSILLAMGLTIFTSDPNSKKSFFLQIAEHQGKLVAGVVVVFFLGMVWKRASGLGAIVAIVAGVALSYSIEPLYDLFIKANAVEQGDAVTYTGFARTLVDTFGAHLNFFHAVFAAALISGLLHVGISLAIRPSEADEKKGELTWVGLGVHKASTLRKFAGLFIMTVALYAVLAVMMVNVAISPTVAAWIAAAWTLLAIGVPALLTKTTTESDEPQPPVWLNDRVYAALLAACAIFLMFYYY
ncbi:MAG: hypothetical protein GC159_16675 [Phycisphaera sp.]|nr:hypothetical protein [Phycisphaera sp.]